MAGRDGDGVFAVCVRGHDPLFFAGSHLVDFVVHHQGGAVCKPEIVEDLLNRGDLRLVVRKTQVDHVEQQIGLHGLFERGAERGKQVVGQAVDEADRVGEQDLVVAV